MKINILFFALSPAVLLLVSCKPSAQETTLQLQNKAKARTDSIQIIVDQTHKNYEAMNNGQLLEKLVDQSKRQKEPFNSLAFRELKKRKDVNADSVVMIVRQLKDANALLPLLLLRRLNAKSYQGMAQEERAFVLTDALEKSKTFNIWGLPHLYLEDASKAMIECGASTIPALKKMLGETRPAPIWGGGQEGMEADKYKYRLCDYALFFLEQTKPGNHFVMPVKPEERDSLIQGWLK